MSFWEDEDEDEELIDLLSGLLRDTALEEGFSVSPEGYVEVDKILQHKFFKKFTSCDIVAAVQCDERKRFKLRHNTVTKTLEVKANTKHSFQVDNADLTPLLQAECHTLIHGTYRGYWPQIKYHGLHRIDRQYIPLAKDISEISSVSNPTINKTIHVYVNFEKALEDGIIFYKSSDGRILTSGDGNGYLKPKYFEKVIEVPTGK